MRVQEIFSTMVNRNQIILAIFPKANFQGASATDAKSANGMTFAQVQDLLAESPFDMSQLTRNLRKGRDGESQEVTLRLRPDELGH